MKASELRIGNLLQDREGRTCKVESIEKELSGCRILAIAGCITSMPVKGIPLTEEWLVKFGFEISKEDDCLLFSGFLYLNRSDSYDWGCSLDHGKNDTYFREIKHVHQLQNLYLALTGKELEVKE